MTEVHRYKVVKMLSEGGSRITYGPHGPEVVMAEAYDQLKAENEALRSAALAAGEFIMHEAEVRGLLDDRGQVSHRHPRRQQAIAQIEAALVQGGEP
ncbi:hypothetical protein [Pseudomonas sp. NFX1]|uniref:hypothetical protein n=1 Tax=Pseudomonas sp. NFX1 TaxID=2201355 RepID=UPI002ACF7160|nr:hypothetical protein [Pseudomonas putida]